MPTINMLSVEARGVDLKTNPLFLGASRARMAVNMVFDEGSIRTRPGFFYRRTNLFGQFQGASEFRPSKGISSGVFSEEPSQLVIAAGGILGTVTLGTSDVVCNPRMIHPYPVFMCLGNVNIYQAENYAIIQNTESSTYWYDGKALTESPGMSEQSWYDVDYYWDDISPVSTKSNITECERSSPEYLNKASITVQDSASSGPIPDALVELMYNRQVAYSGFTNEKGVFEVFVYPRSYQVNVYASGYNDNTSERNKVLLSALGAYVDGENCEQEYQGLGDSDNLTVLLQNNSGALGWTIDVRYVYGEGPCPEEFHQCDNAIFNILVNGVNVGTANLNNIDDGGARYFSTVITDSQAQEIGASSAGVFSLQFQCDLGNPELDPDDWEGACHPGVGWVTVTDMNGDILYDGCPEEGQFLQIDTNIAP